MQVQKVILS